MEPAYPNRTQYLVVAMHSDGYRLMSVEPSEGQAQEKAKAAAEKGDGCPIGVFQLLGAAEQVCRVEWRGVAR